MASSSAHDIESAFEVEWSKHQTRTALFEEVLRTKSALKTCKVELDQMESTAHDRELNKLACLGTVDKLRREHDALEAQHEADMADWIPMEITRSQILFTKPGSMTQDELSAAIRLAKQNTMLLEGQSRVLELRNAIEWRLSEARAYVGLANYEQTALRSSRQQLKVLEEHAQAAETSWRLGYYGENGATIGRADDSEVLIRQIRMIEMSNNVITYSDALEQADRVCKLRDVCEGGWYIKHFGFGPKLVQMLQDQGNFIQVLNWCSNMKYFCVTSGDDFEGTVFARRFHDFKFTIMNYLDTMGWRAPDFVVPTSKLAWVNVAAGNADLAVEYEHALAQYKASSKVSSNCIAVAPKSQPSDDSHQAMDAGSDTIVVDPQRIPSSNLKRLSSTAEPAPYSPATPSSKRQRRSRTSTSQSSPKTQGSSKLISSSSPPTTLQSLFPSNIIPPRIQSQKSS